MKRNYVPTEADRLTGARLRELRNRRGETLKQTVEASNFGLDSSTLAATERGERRLTEIEATRLAAHFGVAVSQVQIKAPLPDAPTLNPNFGKATTEQAWLGNEDKPTLFAVPDQAKLGAMTDQLLSKIGNSIVIDLDKPLTPDEYRAQVWVPYLEARYAADHPEKKAG